MGDELLAESIVEDLEANKDTACDPSKDLNCPPECNPPAGVKFNKVTHYEEHSKDLSTGSRSHGCFEKTGSPVHWHYPVNNQAPDGRCYTARHNFGDCGVAP
ncbi:hypothetical protein [Acinetobacter sp.]|uniref:hypothetical protein n=1 Tax=Acinetobacter sp. TaxID=472 RepID=UPI002FCB18AF